MTEIVLDSGFLIALERRKPRAYAVQKLLHAGKARAHVPTGVVAQVWRNDPRQHVVARLMKAKAFLMHSLDGEMALRIGSLLAVTGASDVVDAHVALLAADLGATVLTSDPDDLRKLDSGLPLAVI